MATGECGRLWCENQYARESVEGGYRLCDDCFRILVNLGVNTNVVSFVESPAQSMVLRASEAYFDAMFPLVKTD